jgi:hypothetical protein
MTEIVLSGPFAEPVPFSVDVKCENVWPSVFGDFEEECFVLAWMRCNYIWCPGCRERYQHFWARFFRYILGHFHAAGRPLFVRRAKRGPGERSAMAAANLERCDPRFPPIGDAQVGAMIRRQHDAIIIIPRAVEGFAETTATDLYPVVLDALREPRQIGPGKAGYRMVQNPVLAFGRWMPERVPRITPDTGPNPGSYEEAIAIKRKPGMTDDEYFEVIKHVSGNPDIPFPEFFRHGDAGRRVARPSVPEPSPATPSTTPSATQTSSTSPRPAIPPTHHLTLVDSPRPPTADR